MPKGSFTGDFDDDFLTVAGDYAGAVDKAITEAAETQLAAVKKQQTRALVASELRQVRRWQKAFRNGELDKLKNDVGAIAGSMAVQINRLLETVLEEGVVLEVDKFSASGDHYTEKVTHPALQQAVNIAKALGIDLGSFLMTPRAIQGAPPPVQVNIGISADEVHARFMARFDDKKQIVDDS